MTKHFLTIALMGLSLNMSAEPLNFFKHSDIPAPLQKKIMRQINSLMKPNAMLKTTTAKERVSAAASYGYAGSWIIQDSVKYMYGKDRSAVFNFTDMEYSNYGSNEGVKADSSASYSFPGGNLVLSSATKALYNSSNNMTTFIDAGGTPVMNSDKYDYTYNSSGQIIKEIEYTWGGSNWDSVIRITYVYNGQGKLIQSVAYDFTSGQDQYQADYTYNANGDMIQLVFSVPVMSVNQPAFRVTNTYDANHNVITTTGQQYGLSGWENNSLDSFAYNSGNSIYVYHRYCSWDSATSAWENNGMETRTMNAQGLPQKQTLASWDGSLAAWVLYGDVLWTYNSNDLPLKAEHYSYSGTTPNTAPDYKRYYYYEYYFDQKVSDIDNRLQVKLYPNPATNMVFVQLDKPATSTMDVSIMNVAGQVVYRQQIAAGEDKVRFSVAGLTPGNYFVTITDLSGTTAGKASLVKE